VPTTAPWWARRFECYERLRRLAAFATLRVWQRRRLDHRSDIRAGFDIHSIAPSTAARSRDSTVTPAHRTSPCSPASSSGTRREPSASSASRRKTPRAVVTFHARGAQLRIQTGPTSGVAVTCSLPAIVSNAGSRRTSSLKCARRMARKRKARPSDTGSSTVRWRSHPSPYGCARGDPISIDVDAYDLIRHNILFPAQPISASTRAADGGSTHRA